MSLWTGYRKWIKGRPPTNLEWATHRLIWIVRWRRFENFITEIAYGWWGWKRWWRRWRDKGKPKPTYGTIGNVRSSRNCPQCGVLLYWKSELPQGDFSCPICGCVQNLYKTADGECNVTRTKMGRDFDPRKDRYGW